MTKPPKNQPVEAWAVVDGDKVMRLCYSKAGAETHRELVLERGRIVHLTEAQPLGAQPDRAGESLAGGLPGPLRDIEYRHRLKNRGEQWRWVPGLIGRYQCSSLGRFRSLGQMKAGVFRCYPSARILSQAISSKGYKTVGLDSTSLAHRVVLLTFFGEPSEGEECDHLDGCRTNNVAWNLKWSGRQENAMRRIVHGTQLIGERATTAKLDNATVIAFKEAILAGRPRREVAREMGISLNTASRIATGRLWKWTGPKIRLLSTRKPTRSAK